MGGWGWGWGPIGARAPPRRPSHSTPRRRWGARDPMGPHPHPPPTYGHNTFSNFKFVGFLTPLTFCIFGVFDSFRTCAFSNTFYIFCYFDSFRTCTGYIMRFSVLIAPRRGPYWSRFQPAHIDGNGRASAPTVWDGTR